MKVRVITIERDNGSKRCIVQPLHDRLHIIASGYPGAWWFQTSHRHYVEVNVHRITVQEQIWK